MGDLSRYIEAQGRTHATALRELRGGRKSTHWSWWEIPQIVGLGSTSMSREYAIENLSEAKEYLTNDTLRAHLLELCEALLSLATDDAELVMGHPDDLKLRSCVTLFYQADPSYEVFKAVLDKYFDGKPDERTLGILREQEAEA